MKRNLFLTLLAIGFPFFVGIMMFASEQTDVTIRDKLVDIKQAQSEISISQEAAIVSSGSDVNKAKIELSPRIDLYVSTNGKKYAKGTIDDPLKTPQEALNIAQKFKKNSVYIWFRGGTYLLEQTLRFNLADSRTPNAPLIFSGYKDENVTLSGAKSVIQWQKVTDDEILKLLSSEVRKHVMVADLNGLKIYDYGSPKGGGVELIQNNELMTIARWPNQGFTTISNVSKTSSESKIGEFYFTDNHPSRWKNEKDIWLHGYWYWDWSDQRQKVKEINFTQKMVSIEKPYHHYGYKKGQWYYAYNLLCEIDREGEWYLDREEGKLYFWPPNDKTDNTALTSLPTLVHMIGVENISFKHINFMNTLSTAVMIEKADNVSIDHAEIRNTGSWGVYITDSHNSGVRYGHITQTGDGGVYLDGGDRSSLTRGNLYVDHCDIHDYARINRMYKPAISLNGVGNIASNNHIYNAPHIGIFFAGNNHLIQNNNIHNVVQESNDAGAVYGLRDWSQYGTVITNNFIHHIHENRHDKSAAIYLDDQLSGVTISNNIIYKTNRGLLIGGGKSNTVVNNLLIDNSQSIYYDARGIYQPIKSLELLKKLNDQKNNTPLFQSQNFTLRTINETIASLPSNSVIKGNIIINDPIWDKHISEHVYKNSAVGGNVAFIKKIDSINDKTVDEIIKESKIYLHSPIDFSRIGDK